MFFYPKADFGQVQIANMWICVSMKTCLVFSHTQAQEKRKARTTKLSAVLKTSTQKFQPSITAVGLFLWRQWFILWLKSFGVSLSAWLTCIHWHTHIPCTANLPVLICVDFFFSTCNYFELTSVDCRIICPLTELTWLRGRRSEYQPCFTLSVDFHNVYVLYIYGNISPDGLGWVGVRERSRCVLTSI